MNILVLPMFSVQHLNGDSCVILCQSFVRGAARLLPDWHFYFVFPDAASKGYTWEDDGFFHLPNVTRIPARVSPRKRSAAVQYRATWWDALFRQLYFDVIWCNQVEVAGHLRNAGEGSYTFRPQVVNMHHYVMHRSLPYLSTGNADCYLDIRLAQLCGALGANWNICVSEYCREMLLDNAREFLAPAQVEAMAEKTQPIHLGPLNLKDFPKVQRPKGKRPVIAYNHRLQHYKRFRETFEILEELYDEGLDFEALVLSPTHKMAAKVRHYPFVRFEVGSPRSRYLELLATADLNVTNTAYETFCVGAVESMALEQAVVAPNGLTFPEITPEGYPYLFDDKEEQKQYIRTLCKDAEERRKWGKTLSLWARRQFTPDTWVRKVAAVFKRVASEGHRLSEDRLSLLSEALGDGEGLTCSEAMSRIRRESNGHFSNQSLPPCGLMKELRRLGWTTQTVRGRQSLVRA